MTPSPTADYVGHLIDRDHEFLRAVPYDDGWSFEGVCSCGFRSHARSAAAAHDKVWQHARRMKWRKEDAEWRASLSHNDSSAAG